VPLKEKVEHEAVLVYSPPKPVTDIIYRCTDLLQIPPGAHPGLPVAKFLSDERAEFNAPLAQRLVAYLSVAPVEQFLDVPVAEWKAVVQLLRAYWMIVMGNLWR
jgi:hypothetical protein